jgi:hypothetical protein
LIISGQKPAPKHGRAQLEKIAGSRVEGDGERIGKLVLGRRQPKARIGENEARDARVGERGLKRQKGARAHAHDRDLAKFQPF